jgi:hypothetical protein
LIDVRTTVIVARPFATVAKIVATSVANGVYAYLSWKT